MAYNTSFTRFKSVGLAGLDCGSYLKIPQRDERVNVTAVYRGDLEVGQCVAMIRIPAGSRIVAADLSWGNGTGNAILAVGDPYACARLIGPASTARSRGATNVLVAAAGNDCTSYIAWGFGCGTMTRTGNQGDGCGIFYRYTCETDVLVTSLYHAGYANLGGWPGAALPIDQLGAKWTGGQITLSIDYLQGEVS